MNSPKITKFVLWCVCATALLTSGCAEVGELQKPVASPYYGTLAPAANNEFRWANGDLPKTFDPALAQSPSEMQAVRAAFDGLTEWDGKTLQAVPAIAARWEPSEDFRTWTFHLRPAAVWSNGKPITAQDFVRSWQRLKKLNAKSPHQQLLSNLVGAQQIPDFKFQIPNTVDESSNLETETPKTEDQKPKIEEKIQNPKSKIQNETWFGAEAVDELTLRVYLVLPDQDFPKLAAHSALRPVFDAENEFDKPEQTAKIVTSGAFRFGSFEKSGILLERSRNYWNLAAIKLERIRFVTTNDAESALAAYRAGEVDAVTNTHFEPLALKLLASYRDFERTTFNALTFYEFNQTRAPFSDRRVREALTIAIDRDRLTRDELDGAMFPAHSFLPNSANAVFKFDARRAQSLMAAAGFPNSKEFPKIKLLVNRNDAQRRLAKAIALQWQKNLGVETEIVISSLDNLDNNEATKDFDLIRRVVVLPTTNESANLRNIFKRRSKAELIGNPDQQIPDSKNSAPSASPTPRSVFQIPLPNIEPEEEAPLTGNFSPKSETNSSGDQAQPSDSSSQTPNEAENQVQKLEDVVPSDEMILTVTTEMQAINEIPAIPLYFPSSYALVKPYITGFANNLLDAPLLKEVEIHRDWRPSSN